MTPLVALTLFGMVASDVMDRMNAEPKTVEQLYAMYTRYGLWLPPKDAKLVRWEEKRVWSGSAGLREELEHHIGLLIREKTKNASALVRWRGYDVPEHRDSRLKVVRPTVAALGDKIDLRCTGLLELAASAHHLGWNELAEECFKRLKEKGNDVRYLGFSVEGDEASPLQTIIRNQAWSHHYHLLTEPDAKPSHSYSMLKRIYDDDKRYREEFTTELLADLKKTLEFKKRDKGIERWIDELCELEVTDRRQPQSGDKPTAYDQLCMAGFDAVPALIEHLNDTRRTRGGKGQGINNGIWIEVERVGTVCEQILKQLSAGRYSPEDETSPEDRVKLAKRWFERAKTIGEESWITERLKDSDRWSQEIFLRVLAAKYPRQFLSLYAAELRNQTRDFRFLVAALAHAKLTREQKLDWLVETALQPENRVAVEALEVLYRFDKACFERMLARHFENREREVRKRSGGDDIVQEFNLLNSVDDAQCWDAVKRNSWKFSAMTRIDLVREMIHDNCWPKLHTTARAELLNSLWEERGIRTYHEAAEHGMLYAFYHYPQLAVRDAVTLAVADYLDIEIPWKPDRSAAEWDALRKKVQAAFAEVRKASRAP
jgi:hypothetical protein